MLVSEITFIRLILSMILIHFHDTILQGISETSCTCLIIRVKTQSDIVRWCVIIKKNAIFSMHLATTSLSQNAHIEFIVKYTEFCFYNPITFFQTPGWYCSQIRYTSVLLYTKFIMNLFFLWCVSCKNVTQLSNFKIDWQS